MVGTISNDLVLDFIDTPLDGSSKLPVGFSPSLILIFPFLSFSFSMSYFLDDASDVRNHVNTCLLTDRLQLPFVCRFIISIILIDLACLFVFSHDFQMVRCIGARVPVNLPRPLSLFYLVLLFCHLFISSFQTFFTWCLALSSHVSI